MSSPTDRSGRDDEDEGPKLRAFLIVITVLSVAAIGLRFWSRAMKPAKQNAPRFWWDDWLALSVLPIFIVKQALAFKMVELGIGRHVWTIPEQDLILSTKLLFISYFFYFAVVAFAKVSILLLYARLFCKTHPDRWFRWALYGTHAVNAAYLIGFWLYTILICDPIPKYWDPKIPGRCGSPTAYWLATAIPTVVIDLVILTIPMPLIWKLKMDRVHKMAACFLIFVGYLVIVVSVGRLVVTIQIMDTIMEDVTYNIIDAYYWTDAEAPITIISICLPGMLNLFRRLIKNTFNLGSRFSDKHDSHDANNVPHADLRNKSSRQALDTASERSEFLEKISLGQRTDTQYTASAVGSECGYGHEDLPDSAIRVQRDVSVV